MTTVMSETLPINSAARNAVWVYDAFVEPRFVGAPLRAPTRKPEGGTR